MLWISCVGIWLALCVSFAVSAAIIGMPTNLIIYEIMRGSSFLVAAIGVGACVQLLAQEWRRSRRHRASVDLLGDR